MNKKDDKDVKKNEILNNQSLLYKNKLQKAKLKKLQAVLINENLDFNIETI
jgi:hypothetical protein